jgi:pimeloyl-ACP methyl ester carboxylesterase
VPHPYVFRQTLQKSHRQRLKSTYVAFFQLPVLPEVSLRASNYRGLARALQGSSHAGAFTADDLTRYRQAWAKPGALTGMLNWYRAAVRFPADTQSAPRIQAPTLLLWGVQDAFLGQEMAQPSIDLCEHGRLELLEAATHWLQHEESDKVNGIIQTFLSGARGDSG